VIQIKNVPAFAVQQGQLEKMFNAYERLDEKAIALNPDGLGIGLTSCMVISKLLKY